MLGHIGEGRLGRGGEVEDCSLEYGRGQGPLGAGRAPKEHGVTSSCCCLPMYRLLGSASDVQIRYCTSCSVLTIAIGPPRLGPPRPPRPG